MCHLATDFCENKQANKQRENITSMAELTRIPLKHDKG